MIGGDIFANRLYDKLRRIVMKSEAVQSAMIEFRVKNPTLSTNDVEAKVDDIYTRMATKFDNKDMRGLAYVVQGILQQMYSGIHISEKEINRVKETAKLAQQQGVPLILLPTHKSHVSVHHIFSLYIPNI